MQVLCKERGRSIVHTIQPFAFTKEGTLRLYDEAKHYPVLFGRALDSLEDFTKHFFYETLNGDIEPQGLIWTIDDYKGMFYLNNIQDVEADAHFAFFDGRLHGREPMVQLMVHLIFSTYKFQRLNAYVPAYAGTHVRMFIERCGFRREGTKRKNAWWKGEWFNTYLYGILPEDVLDGRTDEDGRRRYGNNNRQ